MFSQSEALDKKRLNRFAKGSAADFLIAISCQRAQRFRHGCSRGFRYMDKNESVAVVYNHDVSAPYCMFSARIQTSNFCIIPSRIVRNETGRNQSVPAAPLQAPGGAVRATRSEPGLHQSAPAPEVSGSGPSSIRESSTSDSNRFRSVMITLWPSILQPSSASDLNARDRFSGVMPM